MKKCSIQLMKVLASKKMRKFLKQFSMLFLRPLNCLPFIPISRNLRHSRPLNDKYIIVIVCTMSLPFHSIVFPPKSSLCFVHVCDLMVGLMILRCLNQSMFILIFKQHDTYRKTHITTKYHHQHHQYDLKIRFNVCHSFKFNTFTR